MQVFHGRCVRGEVWIPWVLLSGLSLLSQLLVCVLIGAQRNGLHVGKNLREEVAPFTRELWPSRTQEGVQGFRQMLTRCPPDKFDIRVWRRLVTNVCVLAVLKGVGADLVSCMLLAPTPIQETGTRQMWTQNVFWCALTPSVALPILL